MWPTNCRPRCGQNVRLVLACVILPLTRTSKCRSDWWRTKCPTPAEGDSGTFRRHLPEDQDCKMQTWSLAQRGGHFSATLPKSEAHYALLIFKGAFCALEPSQQCGVQNALHVKRVRASARKLALLFCRIHLLEQRLGIFA